MPLIGRLVVLILAASLLFPLLFSSAALAASGPQLIGQIAQDGTLIAVGYNDPLGTYHPYFDGSTVADNAVEVAVYAPNAQGSIPLTVEQFLTRTVQVPVVRGNLTTTETVTEAYDVAWMNQTVPAPTRALATSTINLPPASTPHDLIISYLNVHFVLVHHTAPPPFPAGMSQLLFYLFTLLLGTFCFLAATGLAAGMKRRARYWPKLSGAMIGLTLVLGIIAAVAMLGAVYPELQFLPWWAWLVPFFPFDVIVMLQVLPDRAQRWLLVGVDSVEQAEDLGTPLWEWVIAEDRERGLILCHSRSWRKAFLRVLGIKTRVTFEGADTNGRPWHGRNTRAQDDPLDIRRVYWLDPGTAPVREDARLGWKPWLGGKLKRPGFLAGEARVPLSGQHSKAVFSVWSELIAVDVVARDRARLRLENARLKARLRAASIEEHLDDEEIVLTELGVTEGIVSRSEADQAIAEVRQRAMRGGGPLKVELPPGAKAEVVRSGT